MVYFKVLVMPILFLSLLIHIQSTAASKSNRSRTKSVPKKLAGLLALSRSGSNSTSRSRSKSRDSKRSKCTPQTLSALTLLLCPETPSLEAAITVEIIGDKDGDGDGANVAVDHSRSSPYTVKIGDCYSQKTIRKIKIRSARDQVVCVHSLVVDFTIMIDQPTEFKKTCPETPDVDDLPCRQFGDAVLKPFVCPAKLTELLQTTKQIKSVPEEMPTDYTPPVYDIKNDMAQASAAIAGGVSDGFKRIVKNRIEKRKTSIRIKPIGKITSFVENVGSFIGALGPVMSIFAGITTIATTFLTPNPFDELAKYMDKQFDQINERLTGLDHGIGELAELLKQQESVLAMADQIRAVRYAVRNYDSMVDRLASEPVCGKNDLLNLREVDIFMDQYRDERVDNSLIDLYEVDFGGVTEAGQGLLKPFTRAYCHTNPGILEKFATEVSFYGYAGTLAHFAYNNLDCIRRGNEECDESVEDRDEWLTRLHRFLKKAEVFKVASVNLPRALYLDIKDDVEKLIDDEVKKVSATAQEFPGLLDKVYTLIKDKVTNRNDWSNICVLKGYERNDYTHILEVAEINGNNFFDYNVPRNVPWHKRVESRRYYVEKRKTDRSYKTVGIKCGLEHDGVKYCSARPDALPDTPPKDRVLFLMFNPKMYQAHNQVPSIQKPTQTVFIDDRDVYAYFDNDGESGMEGDVHVNCFHGCYGLGETQFALIKNT